MREKIEKKITDIIDFIISKDVDKITYNEYRILDNKLSSMKLEEESKERNKHFAEMMASTFAGSFGGPTPLPESTED